MKQDSNGIDLRELSRKVEEKISENPAFRDLLMENPEEALKQLGGEYNYESIKAKVIEKGFYLKKSGELSDLELDMVAGGLCWELTGTCKY